MPLDALEYVVRPYVTPGPHGGIIIPSTPRGSGERATLTWGAKSTMPEVQTGINFQTVCCKDTLTEKDRESTPIRVFQNGDRDSPNWVDIDRPDLLNLDKKESNTCGDNWDQLSGVAQQVNNVLAGWSDLMEHVTGSSEKNCGEAWHFKNK